MIPRGAPATLGLVALLVAVAGRPLDAYLKLGVRLDDGRSVSLKWNAFPVRYFITDRSVPDVDVDQFRSAVADAFDTWRQVATADVGFEFVGYTSAEPFDEDGMSVLGFQDQPELERVLGATTFLIDTVSGEILESDIFFNASFDWSVAAAGESGRHDLQSVVTHEIGHLIGLGHSAIGETELQPGGGRRVLGAEAVMFPIAFSAGNISSRTLKADDISGVSDIYPTGGFRRATGSVSGHVTKDGHGIFGAHVTVFDLRSGALVANFSLDDAGMFTVAGLSPGPHVVRVEPLDDGDLESYFDDTERVDVDFGVTYATRLVVVPRGGAARDVEIAVRAKGAR